MLDARAIRLIARLRPPAFLAALAMLALGLPGCKNDMVYQVSYRPGEMVGAPPEGTVPTSGLEPEVVAREAYEALVNPVPPSQESIERGALRFSIHCTPCHGAQGEGSGILEEEIGTLTPMSERAGPDVTDGYLYSIIRHGSISMPPYGPDLTVTERWDIVNFLRTLAPR